MTSTSNPFWLFGRVCWTVQSGFEQYPQAGVQQLQVGNFSEIFCVNVFRGKVVILGQWDGTNNFDSW